MGSLATAARSLAYCQILNEERDLRRKKPHHKYENGFMFAVHINFDCSYDKLTCYLCAFERFFAGTELFPSGILGE